MLGSLLAENRRQSWHVPAGVLEESLLAPVECHRAREGILAGLRHHDVAQCHHGDRDWTLATTQKFRRPSVEENRLRNDSGYIFQRSGTILGLECTYDRGIKARA